MPIVVVAGGNVVVVVDVVDVVVDVVVVESLDRCTERGADARAPIVDAETGRTKVPKKRDVNIMANVVPRATCEN